jgi:hypothetical protein
MKSMEKKKYHELCLKIIGCERAAYNFCPVIFFLVLSVA